MSDNLTQVRKGCGTSLTYRLEDAMEETPGCVWVKSELIGEGVEASVYKVCKRCELDNGETEDICQFAVKLYENPKHSAFQKEVNNQVTAYRLGIAPRVYDAFICGKEGFIIMDIKQYTVLDYCKKVFNDVYNGKISREFQDFVTELEDHIFSNLIMVLLNNNLSHEDTHLKNIMLDVLGTTPHTLTSYRDPVLIDLSKMESVAYTNATPDQQQKLINQLKLDLHLSFNNIRENKNHVLTDMRTARRAPPEAPRKKVPMTASAVGSLSFDSPVKGYSFTAPKQTKRMSGQMNDETPVKRPQFGGFDSPSTPSTPRPAGGLSFDESPSTPSTPRPSGSLSFDDSPSTPFTPIQSNTNRPLDFGSFDEEEDHESNLARPLHFGQFEDEEKMNDNDSFTYDSPPSTPRLNNRYHSYHSYHPRSRKPIHTRYFADEEKEEMIDPQYYIDGDYTPDDEYINMIDDYD